MRALASRRNRLRVVAAATLLVLALGVARALDPLAEGLGATYFTDSNWSSAIATSSTSSRPASDAVIADWRGRVPDTFSATWAGSLIVLREGTYTFATISDGESSLYLDKALVVDNSRQQTVQPSTGSTHLARGVHSVFATYARRSGSFSLEWLWARGDADLESVPAWALAPRTPRTLRFLASVVLRRAFSLATWLWLAAVIIAGGLEVWEGGARFVAAPFMPGIGAWLIAAGALVLFFVLPHHIESDGRVRYYALAALVEWRDVSSIPYSLVGPLFSLPLYFLGKLFITSEWWCARFNTIVFLGGLMALYRLLRTHLDSETLQTFLLLLIAGSMFAYHLEGYFGEVFTAVLAGVGLLAVRLGRPAVGWTAVIVGVVNTPATLVALAPVSMWEVWRTKKLRHVLPVLIAAGGIALESWLRRGSPLTTGYEGNHGDTTMLTYSGRPGFSYPFFFGLLSVLFSFGKGIVFFAPGLLLPVRKRLVALERDVLGCYACWTIFLIGLLVIYSKWWAWYGGLFWGPRFFLFASLPASLALAVRLSAPGESRLSVVVAVLAILTLSVWVAIDGAVFDLAALATCRNPDYEWLCLYVPEYSPLWRPFVELTRPTLSQAAVGAYFGIVYARLAAPTIAELSRRTRTLIV